MKISEVINEAIQYPSADITQAEQTDHTFSEAEGYIKTHYPNLGKFLAKRIEPGFRALKNPEIATQTEIQVNDINSVIRFLKLKENSYLCGSKQITPSIGYSWHVYENKDTGMGLLYYRDRGMGQDEIFIAAKDKDIYKKMRQVFRDAGLIPTPKPKKKNLDEVSRRDFLKGLGAAGVAAATGKVPTGITAAPAAAEAGSMIEALVAAATSWTTKYMGPIYLDSIYSEAPDFTEWEPGVNDIAEIGHGPHGTMPWGSHFETGVSKGGVPWLHTSFGDENPYEALLTYQDPKTKQFESVRLNYDPEAYGQDPTSDDEGNSVDEEDVGSYIDQRVAGTLEYQPEPSEYRDSTMRYPDSFSDKASDPKAADVATKAAAHGAAEFGLERLAQLAGVKALSGANKQDEPTATDTDVDTMMKNYRDSYGTDQTDKAKKPAALPDPTKDSSKEWDDLLRTDISKKPEVAVEPEEEQLLKDKPKKGKTT